MLRVLLVLVFLVAQSAIAMPRVAIIIDDLGYEFAAGKRATTLPGPVACAILPHAPRAVELARIAHENGKDVLLHLPLQAQVADGLDEPGGLFLDMSRSQFVSALDSNLAAVPHISGINTHRGSMLTRHPGHMNWLMTELAERGDLFFVDSYTTAASIALQVAREAGVPATKRDVFLDPDRARETLVKEFARLKSLARENGFAVGIGHPYPGTLDFLEAELPKLRADGIELIGIAELIEQSERRQGE